MPFQLGMSLYIDHKFGSDQLIGIMHKLAICESQKETVDYKYTYIDATNSSQASSMAVLEKQVEQHIGDNMDHDLITLEGKAGFHGMGLIKVITPENTNKTEIDENRKMRRNTIIKNAILSNMEGLQDYRPNQANALSETRLVKFEELQGKIPEARVNTQQAVIDWYFGWIEGKSLHPNFFGIYA